MLVKMLFPVHSSFSAPPAAVTSPKKRRKNVRAGKGEDMSRLLFSRVKSPGDRRSYPWTQLADGSARIRVRLLGPGNFPNTTVPSTLLADLGWELLCVFLETILNTKILINRWTGRVNWKTAVKRYKLPVIR